MVFGEFLDWNPMLGFEIGITREVTKNTKVDYTKICVYEKFPDPSECMSAEEMILGYTINGAKQLSLEDRKGSIEAGKDADYLVFDEDLTSTDPHRLSHIEPKQVYFAGKQVK